MGRIGNSMFQIAASVNYGIKHDMPFMFPEWDGFKMFKYPFHTYKEKPQFQMFKENGFHYTEIPKMDNVDLFGYFQSSKYWEHCEHFIREIFEPSEEIKSKMTPYMGLLSGNTCALHVRRGDYIRLKDYHYNLPLEYYNKAMDMVCADKYIVFSDDILWCRQHIKCEYMDTGDQYLDFFLMTQCKNFIIANSSFSWWSSFLSKNQEKQIFAPRKDCWFAEKNKEANVSDLYRPEWHLI